MFSEELPLEHFDALVDLVDQQRQHVELLLSNLLLLVFLALRV